MSEAVEASRCHFFENWLMKHKYLNFLKPLGTTNQKKYWSFYPSEPIQKISFNVRHHVIDFKATYEFYFRNILQACLKRGGRGAPPDFGPVLTATPPYFWPRPLLLAPPTQIFRHWDMPVLYLIIFLFLLEKVCHFKQKLEYKNSTKQTHHHPNSSWQMSWNQKYGACKIFKIGIRLLETVQDFLIKLDIKPLMHPLEIRIFSLNNDIVWLIKIMNNLVKDLKILSFKVIFQCLKLVKSFPKKISLEDQLISMKCFENFDF